MNDQDTEKASRGNQAPADHSLELNKLEYEIGATRYENIYQAMWRIFQYLILLAGGLLTFGQQVIQDHNLLAIVASIPLHFWFWSTFLPMDRYGNWTAERLGHLEKEVFEKEYGAKLNHFRHFVAERKNGFWRRKIRRTRFVVIVSYLILFAFTLFFIWVLAR